MRGSFNFPYNDMCDVPWTLLVPYSGNVCPSTLLRLKFLGSIDEPFLVPSNVQSLDGPLLFTDTLTPVPMAGYIKRVTCKWYRVSK